MDAYLQPAEQTEAVLEADERAAVEAEQIVHQITEVALSERPGKAVGDSKGAPVQRHAHRCRKNVDRVIGLRRQDPAIVVWILLGRDRYRGREKQESAHQQS
jgi:hypothetical protein